jgi:hypothetical protein
VSSPFRGAFLLAFYSLPKTKQAHNTFYVGAGVRETSDWLRFFATESERKDGRQRCVMNGPPS